MAPTPSVKVIKSMPFKGATRLWSNRYHFNGGVPANDTQWHALMDAIVNAEKAVILPGVYIETCVGYLAGSDLPVSSKDYHTNGTLAAGGAASPGEVVALIRYATTARTSKNHPVYLFNYMHAVAHQTTGTNQDKLDTATRTAMQTYAAAWISGFSDGVHTCVRAGPNGATATGYSVETYLTHRDFPYTRSA